jgi:carbamoyltransferase
MRVLGINALFHDPSAALVVDGRVLAAAEEERFSRRKHGHRPVPFAAWELPEQAAAWCLEHAGLTPADLDAVAYSYDPALARPADQLGLDDPWDHLRQTYARRAPEFLATALPGLDPAVVRFVPHHVAHAASATLAGPLEDPDVLVLDGRGEATSHLAATCVDGHLTQLAGQALPHSLGLFYEGVTEHLGLLRSSDEYKVMALASYGRPAYAGELRTQVRVTDDGGFVAGAIDWGAVAKGRRPDGEWTEEHADLAASVQLVLEETLLGLAGWLHDRTGSRSLVLAGGVALNCVANRRLAQETAYERVWVQPAAGDAGTSLGAALQLASDADEPVTPMPGADLGRSWTDDEIVAVLTEAAVDWDRPASGVAQAAAECLADDGIVAWFHGRSEFGPRALGHRSLLAHPGRVQNLHRLNLVKGREQFRPVAPMIRAERAAEVFDNGPLPSPYMLFVHDVRPGWRDRIPAVVHVDGTARVQTVDPGDEPVVADLLRRFEQLTGLPVVVNTSLNTAGRPMVDSPRDALECFGSAPVDLLAIGPCVVRRRR